MKTTTVWAAVLVASCGKTGAKPLRPAALNQILFREQFSEASFNPAWTVIAPRVAGATVQLESGAIALAMPVGGEGEVGVRRRLDVSHVRGQRVRLAIKVKTDAPFQSFAHAKVTMEIEGGLPSYGDIVTTTALNDRSWRNVSTAIDIGTKATSAELELVLHGPGNAWFDEVELTVIGASPLDESVRMSAQQVANLATFTRAATLVRYVHPSDQAAELEWDDFLPGALERVFGISSRAISPDDLRLLFSDIAPTVAFATAAQAAVPTLSATNGQHLVRWRRYGLGAPPFAAFREGRDPDISSATGSLRVELERFRGCKSVSFHASGRKLAGPGKAVLFAKLLRAGTNADDLSEPFNEAGGDVSMVAQPPSDTQEIELGIRVSGLAGVTLSSLTLTCDGGRSHIVDIASDRWTRRGAINLYSLNTAKCDSSATCVSFSRDPLDTTFVPERDVLTVDIGSGLKMYMPTAVWADNRQTLPIVANAFASKHTDFANNDLPVRLATVAAAWGTLSLFYPYFQDQHIDWLAALPAALEEAAAACSGAQVQTALAHLLTRLHDNHARITHGAAQANGILPIMLRRFGSAVVITGGLTEYLKTMPVGSELLELDGIDAVKAYDQTADKTSAATEGLLKYLVPLRMGTGTAGTFHRLRVRLSDGRISERIVPLVAFELYSHASREARPASGTELASDVYYLDLDSLSMEGWTKLLPKVLHARAIILDLRGYVTAAALDLLTHSINQEISSPIWGIPQIPSSDGVDYSTSHWSIRPQAPKFGAKLVALIDGRSMSAVETLLQMFYENKLGILVGENSGGTNGNVASVRVPGGFEFRFTGMRAGSADGSTVHGRGFKPDVVVHPTLEGVLAGRDEILEAGVAAAQRVVHP